MNSKEEISKRKEVIFTVVKCAAVSMVIIISCVNKILGILYIKS